MADIATLVETARFEALHGSAIGCAGLVKNLADAVAALTAENERLSRDLATARENYDVMHASWKGLHWEIDQLRAAPDQAEGPQPPRNVPEPTGEFGHFCPACRAVVRWNAQHGWYFCQRCNKARSAVEIMYFRGNQLDADGYTIDPRDAASKTREIL